MKRPFAVIGITMLFTFLMCSIISIETSLWHILVAIISFLLCFLSISIKYLRNQKLLVTICYSVFVSAIVYLCYSTCFYQVAFDVIDYNKESYCINATVCELPIKQNDRYKYKVKTSQIDDQAITIFIEVFTTDKYEIDLYDNITFECDLTNEVSSKYIANKTFLIAYPVSTIDVTHNYNISLFKSIYKSILYIKADILNALDNMYDTEILAIINALIIGDKGLITADVSNNFRIAGLSHTLVLSGLHMSIIAYISITTINKICKNKFISNITVIIFVIFFMVITGLPPSLVRSGIATIIMLLADMINADNDALNSLGIASIVICLANPFVVFDVGMLMSFASTIGIILYQNRLVKFIKSRFKILNKSNFIYFVIRSLVEGISLSVIASFSTLPIMLLMFGSISNIALLSNIVLVQIVPVIIAFAFISIICYFVPFLSFLVKSIVLINSILIKVFTIIVDGLADIPFANSAITDLTFVILLSCLVVAIMLIFQFKNYSFYFTKVIFSFVIIFLGAYFWQDYNINTYAQIDIYSSSSSIIVDVQSLDNSATIYTSDSAYISQTNIDILSKNARVDALIVADYKSSSLSNTNNILQSLVTSFVCLANDKLSTTGFANVDNLSTKLKDKTIKLNSSTNINLVLVNGEFWVIIEVEDSQILVLPYSICKSDINLFCEKYDLADFDIIISSKTSRKLYNKYFGELNNWYEVGIDSLKNIKYLPNLSIKIPF